MHEDLAINDYFQPRFTLRCMLAHIFPPGPMGPLWILLQGAPASGVLANHAMTQILKGPASYRIAAIFTSH